MSGQRYTPEFKDEAVKLVLERGYSSVDVSNRLGVSQHSIYKWIKAAQPLSRPKDKNELLEAKKEMLRLKGLLKQTRRRARYFKKGRQKLCEESKEKSYEFILEHLLCFHVSRMAKVFGISRSGLYYQIQNRHKDCLREQAREFLYGKVINQGNSL